MAAPQINQFKQSPVQGQLDLSVDPNTISVMVDATQATAMVPGQAVKIVDSAGGVPKVIACDADEDDVFGFINYDVKSSSFSAGDYCEISFLSGNIMYMTAGAAIARWAEVMIVVADVEVITATNTNRIIGRALDKATAPDQLIRVAILLPGAIKA